MPTTPRKATPNRATRRATAKAKPQGTFARLRAEALQDALEIEPYVINDVEPPIVIEAPDTVEQQMALLEMFDNEGQFRIADARRVLETVCGESFDRVWELLRAEKLPVMLRFIQEVGAHFGAQGGIEQVDEEDFPGGSRAS